jgi:hypothetical protein
VSCAKRDAKWCSPRTVAMLYIITKLFYKEGKTPLPTYGCYHSMLSEDMIHIEEKVGEPHITPPGI